MRRVVTVPLAPGRDAEVLEARVRDLRRLLELLATEPAGLTVQDLHQHAPTLVSLLGECLRLPPGETVDDLTLTETERLIGAWWELHADFFQRALRALGLVLAETPAGAPSTAPASP